MNSILYVGMDVHTTNYTLCTYSIAEDKEFALTQVKPDHLNILRYIDRLKQHHGQDTRIICGYEAGGLGYSLYRTLASCSVECVILAPSTMPKDAGFFCPDANGRQKNCHRVFRMHPAA